MVQSYLRHGPTQAFGLVCSSSSNSWFDGVLAYVPALEDVLVWNVRKSQMVDMWHDTGHTAEVTCIEKSPVPFIFAAGYADGSIRIWNASTTSVVAVFNGHSRAVTALIFDASGTRLASGSQDTELILWDMLAESGLFRLRGHRDQVTRIRFLHSPDSSTTAPVSYLLTVSKDTFMKLWDLTTQHCLQTIVAHGSDVWAMDLDSKHELIFTGDAEGSVKAWRIDHSSLARGLDSNDSGEMSKFIHPMGSLPLASSHRVSQISFHRTQPYVAIQSHDKSVEILRIRSETELRKKQTRREKRLKDKAGGIELEGKNNLQSSDPIDILVDRFTPHTIVRASGKVRSLSFNADLSTRPGNLQLLLALNSNSIEVYQVNLHSEIKSGLAECSRLYSVDLPGHRSDIRSLSLSSDDEILASASNGQVKIWNMKTTNCIRTMECGYAICCTFLPEDRQLAVGLKSSDIVIYDIASASLVDTIHAHNGTVWSLHIRHDLQEMVSGGADKEVKFWKINSYDPSASSTLVHNRTLKMSEDVLSVRYSPNGQLVAVALLDATVKVFYQDSLKFFLSLYGHKLPVLSMDISSDSRLIVTCSADKNVKIWGLDFGDCHKSIFAHDESVMQVAFETNSHYFWTTGKDKKLKYWDGDKFQNIQTLEGHHGEIWALALSHHGKFVVTGSNDKSIRVWEKLDEPLFLEEERERELDALYDQTFASNLSAQKGDTADEDAMPESTSVSKQTPETLVGGERIMEALELADTERRIFSEYHEQISRASESDAIRLQPPARNPVLAAYNLEPEAWVLRTIERIPSSALHDALVVLPFNRVLSLMVYLDIWARKGWNILLTSRIIFFLLKVHHHQVVSHRALRTSLIPLRKHLRLALQQEQKTIGYNMAGLHFLKTQRADALNAQFLDDRAIESIQEVITTAKKRKRVAMNT